MVISFYPQIISEDFFCFYKQVISDKNKGSVSRFKKYVKKNLTDF